MSNYHCGCLYFIQERGADTSAITNMNDSFTPQELVKLNEKIKAASDDTTPYLILKENEIHVPGDANLTEVKKTDYAIKFRYPRNLFTELPDGAREVGDFVIFSVTYPDITITPRRDLKIISEIFKLKPFMQELKGDGSVGELTNEEIFTAVADAPQDVLLALYNLVATFLGIDDIAGEYMLPSSVISAMAQIIDTHPEIFNEADAFFG